MKLTVHHHHLRSSDELDSLIENRILALQPRLRIDEATVRLECRFEESPAFSVRVHLVTPGPDLFAERRDHTIRAAIEKLMADVEAKIGSRFEKRRWRIRSNLGVAASRQSAAILKTRRLRRLTATPLRLNGHSTKTR